jgi:hypothetical protein
MLYKQSFMDRSARRFDYLDSPNHTEHTHDRCRWNQVVNQRDGLFARVSEERARVVKEIAAWLRKWPDVQVRMNTSGHIVAHAIANAIETGDWEKKR